MAHGCPVVVSRVASLPEVCGDAAEYVDPKDIGSIARGMTKMLTDTRRRTELVTRGILRARQFQWKRVAQQHLRVFEHALHVPEATTDTQGYAWRFLTAAQAHSLAGMLLSTLFRFHPK
jgi:hypothetical protein